MSIQIAFFRWLAIGLLLASNSAAQAQAPVSPPVMLVPLESPALPNALQLNSRLISGGQPDGEAAFAELRRLGVRTVISVDGATPDVAAAEKHGLRYVHLPHGYDGISAERAAELAKAVRDLPGPIYLHCHHGKHRSPAAAATACRALGWLDEPQAERVLQQAGTSPHYLGLFASVRETSPLDPNDLDKLQVEFRSTVPLPEVAEAMVAIELHFDRLEQLAANRWLPLPKHPDLKPAHEALLLREQYAELLRTGTVQAEPLAYQEHMREGERLARELETLLAAPPSERADQSLAEKLKALKVNCNGCHRQYRDQPAPTREANEQRGPSGVAPAVESREKDRSKPPSFGS